MTATIYLELVEVTFHRGRAGETVPACLIDEVAISIPSADDFPADLVLWNRSGEIEGGGGYIKLPFDWCGFSFRFIGWSFDGAPVSGMACEYEDTDALDVFEGSIDELTVLASSLLDEQNAKESEGEKSTCLTFTTIWEFRSIQDYPEYQTDTEWRLLGLLDFKKLDQALRPLDEIQAQAAQAQVPPSVMI